MLQNPLEAAESCPGLHYRPQSLNINGKVAECLVGSSSESAEPSHLNSELVAVKFGQFNARLSSLVSAKICDHVNQQNQAAAKPALNSLEARLEEFKICDVPKSEEPLESNSLRRRSASCEPSAPDLSCLSPEKRRTDITPESLFVQQPPETTTCIVQVPTRNNTEICRIAVTPGSKFSECNFTEMSDSELARISFCEIPAKDEGYNTLTSEIIPDFETSLHTDLTRLLPDLAEESEASFDFSKLQPLRHSYPPLNTKIKFQHLLSYFSDSQLFLRFPDLNPGSVIRFSDFWDYEPGFDLDSSNSNFEFGGSESLWNIEELMKSERPLSLTPSITPSSSSDSDQSNSLSDSPHENSSNVEFTNDYYCLVRVGSVKSLASSPQIQNECSGAMVLCEFTLNDKLLPQESMPLLKDTDDNSETYNLESQEDNSEMTQIEELKPDDDELEQLELGDCLAESSSSSNDTDSKSSSDLDLSPSELEFFTVTDLKHKRYNARHYFTESPHRNVTLNHSQREKSKSESQLNTQKVVNKKRPKSECFQNKSQSIHKSYYNNFVKFSPKRSSVSNEELQIPCTSKVQNREDLSIAINDDLISKSLELCQQKESAEPSTSKTLTETSACTDQTKFEETSDSIKLFLQDDKLNFDCLKGDSDFTSDSKKIIETLNRMIQKSSNSSEEQLNRNSIEFKEGIPTSWVHFEKQTNFSDPKVR